MGGANLETEASSDLDDLGDPVLWSEIPCLTV